MRFTHVLHADMLVMYPGFWIPKLGNYECGRNQCGLNVHSIELMPRTYVPLDAVFVTPSVCLYLIHLIP